MSKLYRHATTEFGIPVYVDFSGKVSLLPAGGLPLMYWPDGRWCFEASFFMGYLARQGLSRRYRGGTLLTYAAHITPLLRYCFANGIDLFALSDNHFRLFMRGIVGEKRRSGEETLARSERTSIQVGRTCLRFLSFLSDLSGSNIVGPSGQVKGELRTTTVLTGSRGRIRRITYWHHSSFPTPSPARKRLPVSANVIASLRSAVARNSSSVYQKKRRYIMLKLLEITGGRRSEVAALTVKSVLNAFCSSPPMLEIITVKGRGGQTKMRQVPISTNDLILLKEFIDKNRSIVIRNTCGKQKDQGFLLVSETTGKALQPNTITQEVSFLARMSGIEDRVSPHMFRHRFITKLFVALIEQHRFENSDAFRRALVSTEDFKRKVLEWTGHRNILSLEPYLHLAFSEVSGVDTSERLALARFAIDSFSSNLEILESDLEQGEDPKQAATRIRNLISALRADISAGLPKG